MDVVARRRRLEHFAARCRDRGLPMTPQRRAVLEAVLELDTHPTADQIHERVLRRMPDVNRTTVYRTLETLVAMDLVHRFSHPGRAVRFDPRIDRHHHLVCTNCETVIDLDAGTIDPLNVPDTSTFGFAVEDYSIQLRGLCRSCRAGRLSLNESKRSAEPPIRRGH